MYSTEASLEDDAGVGEGAVEDRPAGRWCRHGYSPLTSTDHVTPSGRSTTIAWVLSTVPVWPNEPSPNDISPSPYHRPAVGYGAASAGCRISSTIAGDSGCQPGVAGSSESMIVTMSDGVATHEPAAPSTSM